MKIGIRHHAAAFRLLVSLTLLTLAGATCEALGQTPTPTPTPLWVQSGTNISNINAGNVGVGTASPTTKLDVRGSIALNGVVPSAHAATNYTALWLKNNVAVIPEVASGYSVITLGTNYQRIGGTWSNVDTSLPAWSFSMGAGPGYDQFSLTRSPAGTYTPSTLMTINSSGYVGIGISNPSTKLDVQGGSINASGGLCIAGVCKSSWADVGGSSQWNSGASGIGYSSGNVGIGTNNPANNLHLNVPGSSAPISAMSIDVGTFSTYPNAMNSYFFRVRDIGGASTPFYIRGDGNVGVGTTTPNAGRLVVNKGGGVGLAILSGSNNLGQWTGLQIGRAAADGSLGVATQAGEWAANAAAGDIILKTDSASNKLILNSGGGAATLVVNNGNVGIGKTNPATKLDVAGDITVTGTGNITASGAITGGTISATYQDVAEWVPSTQKLQAGTVVVLDVERNNHVLASTKSYDTRVAGVVSALPGVILGEGGDGKIKVATTGRVKVVADATRAAIKVGDLLVTSDVGGAAMKSVPVDLGGALFHRPGTIIGKALEPLASGKGEILVLLSLQ